MLNQDDFNQNAINTVKDWILDTIIGFNFCPFAKKEFDKESIHFELVDDKSHEEQLHALSNEFSRLDNHSEIETTVVIYPVGLESFFDYLDFLEVANMLLDEREYTGIYQLASFHPDYCFSDSHQDDAANYTNRSPYPLIHIIREKSMENALRHHPDPTSIPENNIALAKEKGAQVFIDILNKIKNKHLS